MGNQSLTDILRELKPISLKWLVDKGYCTVTTEDGCRVIQITEQGHEYFAKIKVLKAIEAICK